MKRVKLELLLVSHGSRRPGISGTCKVAGVFGIMLVGRFNAHKPHKTVIERYA